MGDFLPPSPSVGRIVTCFTEEETGAQKDKMACLGGNVSSRVENATRALKCPSLGADHGTILPPPQEMPAHGGRGEAGPPEMFSTPLMSEHIGEWPSQAEAGLRRHLGSSRSQLTGRVPASRDELSGTGLGRGYGAYQTGISFPLHVASTQHVLGDDSLPGSLPVQAAAEFRVDDGNLQLL